MTALIIWLLVSMLFSAFFSGMEIAFVSSNRLRAEMDREKNRFSQRIIKTFYQHPNNFVSTMLVGNNISLVIYGILFAKLFDSTLFEPLSDGVRDCCLPLLCCLLASSCPSRYSRTILTRCSRCLPFRRGFATWCFIPFRDSPHCCRKACCALWAYA